MRRQVLWSIVPVVSIGYLSFVPFLGFAMMTRRARDWAVFGAYLAATVGLLVAAHGTGSGHGGGSAVGVLILVLAGCAAVHSAILFRPSHAPTPLGQRSMNRGTR